MHELLVDVDAWSLWSPHVATVSSDRGRIDSGWGGGCTVRFTAGLGGPAAAVLERLVAPFSERGQRRRMARLVKLAELVEGRARTS